MALDKILYTYDGLSVEVTTALTHSGLSSFLATVPVKVRFDGQQEKTGHLVYDKGKRRFITAITDFYEPRIDFNTPQGAPYANLANKVCDELSESFSKMYQAGLIK